MMLNNIVTLKFLLEVTSRMRVIYHNW